MASTFGLVDFSGDSEVQSGGRCVSTYMRKYLFRTDSAVFLTEPQVAGAIGITRGSPLSDTDTNAVCHKVSIGPGPVMTKAPFLAYYATYYFATNATVPEEDDDDPTTTRTLWSVSPQIQSRYVIKDRNGKLIVNTAKQPYDGGIPVDVRLGSVTASRRKDAAGYNMASVLANSGKLNSAPYLGGAAGTVQVDISASEKYEGAFHFWEETYKFSYDPQGWQPKPTSAGFFERISSTDLRRILNSDLDPDGTSDPVQEPEPLDDDGILVPIADRPDGCVFVEVDYFPTMDFSSFGL